MEIIPIMSTNYADQLLQVRSEPHLKQLGVLGFKSTKDVNARWGMRLWKIARLGNNVPRFSPLAGIEILACGAKPLEVHIFIVHGLRSARIET